MEKTAKQKVLEAVQRAEWHLADQKRYAQVAANTIKKLDDFEKGDRELLKAYDILIHHREKLNHR